MRNEKEVLGQLLEFAQNNELVRAVIMNGSRVNSNAPKDIFRDYDIVFVVTDYRHFLRDQSWIKCFGELIIMQQNDCSEGEAEWCIFLLQFNDGVRIDLSFHPVEHINIQLEDTLKLVLLDKDNIIGKLEAPNDTGYFVRKPSKERFEKTANEFWWCSTNVAKGLWREELCYVKYMYEVIVKDCLTDMVSWYISMNNDWSVDVGKAGKWFKRLLPKDVWESLEKTYSGANSEDIWESLIEAGRLFRRLGTAVADGLGYCYPLGDDSRVTEYLSRVRQLPKDAEEIL